MKRKLLVLLVMRCCSLIEHIHATDESQQAFLKEDRQINHSLMSLGAADDLVCVEIKNDPSPSTARTLARATGALILSAGVANGMIPIFLTDALEAGVDVHSWFLPIAVYTGLSFGLETAIHRYKKMNDVVVPNLWYGPCLVSSAIPVLLLFQTENNHHNAAQNLGWDDYYTFFATLSPFLAVNQFLNILDLGKGLFKSDKQKAIDATINQLSKSEIDDLLDEINQTTGVTVSLPCRPVISVSTKHKAAAAIIALASIPSAYVFFENTLEESCHLASSYAYTIATIPSIGCSVLGYISLVGFEKRDWYCLAQGAFKALPLCLLVWSKTQDLPTVVKEISFVAFVLTEVLQKTRELKRVFFTGLHKLPKIREKLWAKKELLKEKLV